MSFEIEILTERFDTTENEVWILISRFWKAYKLPSHLSAFAMEELVPDIRRIKFEKGIYFNGINLEIQFVLENQKLIIWGAAIAGNSPYSRMEHVFGTIEVKPVTPNQSNPVYVNIICKWEPFYLLFKDMALSLETEFKNQLVTEASNEILDFKSLVERQTYKDIFSKGKPKENIARGFLQHHLSSRSYREIPVKGGQSDLLIFNKKGRFLYETKIWRGQKNFRQGLKEIEEYILGEDNDNKLTAIFYIVFDPTVTSAARKFLKSDLSFYTIANRTIRIVVININPPRPSKKQ